MLISKNVNEGLNAQVGREYFASMQYIAMAAWFDDRGLSGLAAFFFKQAEEESQHGLKIVKYLGETGGDVVVPALDKPQVKYRSVVHALEHFVELEEDVTRRIFDLVEVATADKDHSAFEFLQWYVAEQREEVSSARALLEKAKGYGEERIHVMDGLLGSE